LLETLHTNWQKTNAYPKTYTITVKRFYIRNKTASNGSEVLSYVIWHWAKNEVAEIYPKPHAVYRIGKDKRIIRQVHHHGEGIT